MLTDVPPASATIDAMRNLRFSLALLMICLGRAFAEVLAILTPCAAASKSVQPITVTAQHQLVSTCSPSTGCIRGKCTAGYKMQTFAWVSTVIPCAWDGTTFSSCTVTKTDQAVTVSRTSALSTAMPQRSSAVHINVDNPFIPLMPSQAAGKVWQAEWKWWAARYDQLGPFAIPGYEGSGLCSSDCAKQQEDTFHQRLNVTVCMKRDFNSSPVCGRYSETWIALPAPEHEQQPDTTAPAWIAYSTITASIRGIPGPPTPIFPQSQTLSASIALRTHTPSASTKDETPALHLQQG
ncbi:hypothetical protein LTR96_008638 [Exophiala xenobiotica]|nr:hypothetical protein H2202_008378 [Exophiala xenobiotica]KAK5223508.1 hypothetical protein LTR72_004894 [Exophiala xenobiotica]KAK5230455.1 hypothetical protein LTR47_007597 [Exophiala xenobiotica]KAK5266243.1 hypothetical protein LTR96_008638 [Exophiala xenobiotica]KAK5286407.1 hypothetical protein LTR14_010075 [Exophiala xenobiotica]